MRDIIAKLGTLKYDVEDKMMVTKWLLGKEMKVTKHTERIVDELGIRRLYNEALIKNIHNMNPQSVMNVSNYDLFVTDKVMMREKLLNFIF